MEADLINSYAVVAYAHGEFARFVNTFRCEATPGCPHRAHITVLPPRSLSVPTEKAVEECRQIVSRFQPFAAEIHDVSLFEETRVIKLAVASGLSELWTLHDILNTGPFEYVEPYEYIPHITMCMKTATERTDELFLQAQRRWQEFGGYARLWIDTLTFVHETWADIAEMTIGEWQPVRVRR